MNRDMICTWLGLADKRWPPDHYALLGLTPGECDGPRIETRVQERMAKLRCYQLSHPDEATEGMNRVAQAFIALVEKHCPRPEVSRPSAPALPPAAPPADKRIPHPLALGDTAVGKQTKLDWENVPPPVRAAKPTPLHAIPVGLPETTAAPRVDFAEPSAPAETEEQVIRSLAEESDDARAGVLTLQAIIARADLTRQLLIAWRKAGRYLALPRRKLTRPAEKSDFTHKLEALLEAADRYPDFIAHPGRPGYRAVALAHLSITPEVFNAMAEEPREQLARDWTLAHKILLAHRVFLLRQFKALRRRGPLGRAAYILRTSLRDHWVMWSGLVAMVAVSAATLLGIVLFWH
jgi:hypothetical protein